MGEKGLTIAPIFGDGMILQRDTYNRIYGTETIANSVSILFQDTIYSAMVDNKNNFCIELPPVEAGGPYSMSVRGSSEVEITDILFGDVYLLSGQSNMELQIKRVLDVSGEEIEQTCEPTIRQYLIPATYNFSKAEQFMYPSDWKKAEGKDLLDFSAVGYFFAKELKEKFSVPIGLIMTAVGGSKIESWMSPVALSKFGDYELMVEVFKEKGYLEKYLETQHNVSNDWLQRLDEQEVKFDNNEDISLWESCEFPGLIKAFDEEPFCGSIYLCKEIELEDEPVGSGFIYLGTIVNADRVYINGIEVGRTEYRYPPRKYDIPEGVLKKGKNLVLIHIIVSGGNGGTVKNRPYYIQYNSIVDGRQEKQTLDLCGVWHQRVGLEMDCNIPPSLFPPLLPIGFYNTVVVPLSKISLKGVLWYQGESNAGDGRDYADKFEVLVNEWREKFGANLPFIFAQLSNYQEPLIDKKDTGWAWLRDEQRKCLALDNVAMAVTLDIGEYSDLHPQNKKEVGLRFAQAALALIYGEDIDFSGPVPTKGIYDNGKITLNFDYLEEFGEEITLNNFEIGRKNNEFHPANAIRKGSNVEISCEGFDDISCVRYAWLDAPENINFFNNAKLPACGFKIDL